MTTDRPQTRRGSTRAESAPARTADPRTARARTARARTADARTADARITRGDVRTALVTVTVGLLLNLLGLRHMYGGPILLPPGDDLWWFTALLLVGGALLVVKRLRPTAALAAGAVLLVGDGLIGGSLAVALVVFDLLYTVGRYSSDRARTVVVVIIAAVAITAAAVAGEAARDIRVFVLVGLQVGAVGMIPLWWAAEVRQGDQLARAAADRARLESERADAVQRAAASERSAAVREERAAMAGDLHDLVSSHLSAIAIHSGAALTGTPDADRQRAALQQVRAEAVASLDGMRSMVALLRSAGSREEWTTSAGLDAVPDLLARFCGLGLDVTADLAPVPPGLPPAVGQAAYRVVQEALTNAMRHGGGAVRLTVGVGGPGVGESGDVGTGVDGAGGDGAAPPGRGVGGFGDVGPGDVGTGVDGVAPPGGGDVGLGEVGTGVDGAAPPTADFTGRADRGRGAAPVGTDAGRTLVVTVTNALREATEGPGGAAASGGAPASSGTGLLSMRERVTASGGILDAGPAGPGWRVRATFPLERAAVAG